MCVVEYILHIIRGFVYLTEVMFVRGYDSSAKQCMFCVSWFIPYSNIGTSIKREILSILCCIIASRVAVMPN